MFAINCDKVSAFSYLIGLNTQMCARFDTYISYKNWISVHPPLKRQYKFCMANALQNDFMLIVELHPGPKHVNFFLNL